MCSNTCLSRTTCSLSRYKVKGELDCFNCKMGGFLRLFTSMFTKKAIIIHVFAKKSNRLRGIITNYKEKHSVPTVHTAALIESKAWFPLSQLRPRQRPISSQNKAISVKDDCSTL